MLLVSYSLRFFLLLDHSDVSHVVCLRSVEQIYFTSKVVLLDFPSKNPHSLLWHWSESNPIIWVVKIFSISLNSQYFSNKSECDIQETPASDTLRATLDKSNCIITTRDDTKPQRKLPYTTRPFMFFWPCIMNFLYINYQLDALIIIYS